MSPPRPLLGSGLLFLAQLDSPEQDMPSGTGRWPDPLREVWKNPGGRAPGQAPEGSSWALSATLQQRAQAHTLSDTKGRGRALAGDSAAPAPGLGIATNGCLARSKPPPHTGPPLPHPQLKGLGLDPVTILAFHDITYLGDPSESPVLPLAQTLHKL